MSSLPELSEVLHILSPIEDRYFGLGIHLGIKIQQLKSIESNYPDTSRRLTETISLWQENSTGECSWSTLAKAVERIGGHDRLAKELRERYVTNDLMEADSKPQMHHPTVRTNESYLSMSESTQSRQRRHDSRESEDESGYSSKSDSNQSGDSSGSEAECSSRSDSAAGDSSGCEIKHFDEIPGCGCDKPCPIYKLCAGGCPNPTSTKVGVVRKRVQGQEVEAVLLPEEKGDLEEEEYAEKFEKETRRMRVQFAELVSDTCDSLKKKNVATADLILFLQHASPLALKPRIDEMTKATSLAQVLTIVTGQTCSWFDYEMMTVLINRFGDDDDKKRLKQYEANFYRFAEQRLPKGKKHIEVGSGARVGGKQLVIKIDKEWDEVNFSDLKKIRGNLASLLDVRSRDLYLADIREGCIMMTFMITEELARRLPLSRSCLNSSQVRSLKGEGVISLRCGKLRWRTARQIKAKMVPQNSPGWRFNLFSILDLRVMMTVMLLLVLVLAGFSGVLVRMQAGRLQVNNHTHAESDIFTLRSLQVNTTRNVSSLGSSCPLIATSRSYWDRCPAYLPTKVKRQRNVTNYTDSSGDGQVNRGGPSPSLKQLHALGLIVDSIDSNWTNSSHERKGPGDVIVLNPDGEGVLETATFTCKAIGRPAPEIKWTYTSTLDMLEPLTGSRVNTANNDIPTSGWLLTHYNFPWYTPKTFVTIMDTGIDEIMALSFPVLNHRPDLHLCMTQQTSRGIVHLSSLSSGCGFIHFNDSIQIVDLCNQNREMHCQTGNSTTSSYEDTLDLPMRRETFSGNSLKERNVTNYTESSGDTFFNSLESSGALIARPQSYWDSCPAYTPTTVTRQWNIISYTDSSSGEQASSEGPSPHLNSNCTNSSHERMFEIDLPCKLQLPIRLSISYDICPAYLPTKVTRQRNVTNSTESGDGRQESHEGPSPCLKQLPQLGLLADSIDDNWINSSNKHIKPSFLDVNTTQTFTEGEDAVIWCPVNFGSPIANMQWTYHKYLSVTLLNGSNRFVPDNGSISICSARCTNKHSHHQVHDWII